MRRGRRRKRSWEGREKRMIEHGRTVKEKWKPKYISLTLRWDVKCRRKGNERES